MFNNVDLEKANAKYTPDSPKAVGSMLKKYSYLLRNEGIEVLVKDRVGKGIPVILNKISKYSK
jgi:hypothetical protein